ncbi:MAG: radical SAM protein [Clostridia bacterium]|nr:radical SAM protein [Clostridia bacterium]
MEEEKKNQVPQNGQNQNGQGGQGGRRRRRHKHKGGQNAQNQTAQNEPNKPAQTANGQKSEKAQKGQAQKQNGQPQGQKQPKAQPAQQPQPQKQKQKQPQPQKQANGKKQQEQQRKDTYAYALDGNLYINLTNKCSNACDFCVRNERTSYFGHYLWINHGDPTVEKVISACNGMGDLSKFKEIVFCGFGEPTYRMDEMRALCDYFHEKGAKTRLNTNGQGSLINKRDIVPELKGKIDKVNVSLNASCAENYQKICRSQFGENGFGAMLEFAKACKRAGIECRFSIVDNIGETEIESCKKVAQSVNVPLYVRKYISDC